ncbi:MAG: DnaJ domain-containing protein, partial [Methylocella sp.]
LRGRFDMALGLGGLGAWLLGLRGGSLSRMFKSHGGPRTRKVSCVRSAMIEMELDHGTGKMRGTVLAGPDEGKSLDAMTRPQCEALHDLCCRDDPEGARLMEAYLDRRFAGWRTAAQNQRHPGRGHAGGRAGTMSEDEAYEVLGLQKGASDEEVARSHRSLMKKLHPDHGGSTDLAARVNEAKDVLMRRHQ